MANAALRDRVEAKDEDTVRKLPPVERQDRKRRLATRLPGLQLDGPWEPSSHLVDVLVNMIRDGALRY
eukprot:4795153-Amphidinium_carterae.1